MKWLQSAVLVALAVSTVPVTLRAQQMFTIGSVDLYGLRQVPEAAVRAALTVKAGDIFSPGDEAPVFIADSLKRLRAVPGVRDAAMEVVCCDADKVLVYVGLAENGSRQVQLRSRPRGVVRLSADIVKAGDDFDAALEGAILRGDFEEDDTQGHALFHDPGLHAVQVRFVTLAKAHLAELRRVLRDSSDEDHRALAAQVLGYAPLKKTIVPDLLRAITDPGDNVRNNAMRALAVIAGAAATMPEKDVHVPLDPFIEMLSSLTWTDRNKASLALSDLTASRVPDQLAALRPARPALAEMARWTSEGHAMPAFSILARMAGVPEDDIESAWRTRREAVIAAALL